MILLMFDAAEYVSQEAVWYLLMMFLIGTASEKQVWPQKKEEEGGRGQFNSSRQGIFTYLVQRFLLLLSFVWIPVSPSSLFLSKPTLVNRYPKSTNEELIDACNLTFHLWGCLAFVQVNARPEVFLLGSFCLLKVANCLGSCSNLCLWNSLKLFESGLTLCWESSSEAGKLGFIFVDSFVFFIMLRCC